MKKTTLFCLLMVLALVFTSWAPAQATDFTTAKTSAAYASGLQLTITNNLPKATTVTLTGPKNYTINVYKGAKVTKTIDSGTYKYSYAGCLGKVKKGNLKAKGSTAALVIPACPMANVTFINLSSSYVSLKLTGWMNYNISIGGKGTTKMSIVAATYDAVLSCGGRTSTGKLKFKKGSYGVTIRC